MRRLTPLAAALAALAVALAGCAHLPAPDSAGAAMASATAVEKLAVTGDIHHYRLGNGMEVIIKPDRRAPTAIHMVWVRAGSIDEVDGASGIAHMLEHMMFKGSATVAPGEFSRRVSALGGQENAFTSRDYTGYYQQVPADKLAEVMRLEADRFAHNQWPDEEFLRERDVVAEERRSRTDDNPRAKLYEQLMATAFVADPARRPVIGWMADIANYTAQDVRDFYRKWYVPGNAALVVVGQVEPSEVLALAAQTYGRIPAAAVPARKPKTDPVQNGQRRITLNERAEQHLLYLAYKAPLLQNITQPTEQDRDALALIALSGVLDGYQGARLERALTRGPERLADSVGSHATLTGRSGGLFLLTGIPAPGVEPQKLEQALQAQITRIAQEGIGAEELRRVITQWTASTIYEQDAIYAQASELGSAWIAGMPLNRTQTLVELLRQVTPEQVQSVAQRYFHPDQLTVAHLNPTGATAPIPPAAPQTPTAPAARDNHPSNTTTPSAKP